MEATTTFLNGSSLGSVLPNGGIKKGMTNFVVPEAGEEGGPPGWHSKIVPDNAVVHDTETRTSYMINPSVLTKQAMAAAGRNNRVRQPGTTMDQRRERSQAALLEAATVSGAMVPMTGNATMMPMQFQEQVPQAPSPSIPPQQVPYVPSPVLPQALPPQATAAAFPQLPMQMQPAAFSQPQAMPVQTIPNQLPQPQMPPQSLFARLQGQTTSPQATAAAPPAAPPTRKIRLEVQGSPITMESYFHEISVTGNTLLLAWDTRTVGYPKSFPPLASVCPAPIGVELDDGSVKVIKATHLVNFLHYELCVAEILERVE